MKCFSLDGNGDLMIQNNDIVMVSDVELLAQKMKQVLSTNKGEWLFDKDEGIRRREIIRKNPNYAIIKDQIRQAAKKVDSSVTISNINFMTENDRKITITFAINGANTSINL